MNVIGNIKESLTVASGRRVRVVCGDGKACYLVRGSLRFEDGKGWFVHYRDRGVKKVGLVEKEVKLDLITLDGLPWFCFEDGEFVARFIGANRSEAIAEKSPELIEKVIGRRLLKCVAESLVEPKMSIIGIPFKWILIIGGIGVVGYFVYSLLFKGEAEPEAIDEGVKLIWLAMAI